MRHIISKEKLLYGGDYNPEQWLDCPEILAEDIKMMRDAHINTVTMGVFSWSALEREEGKYDFGWLAERIDTLYQNGISTILATPSGAKPKWLADKYPEVLRTDPMGLRARYGFRHNHCMSSPVYREKIYEMDRRLSAAFGTHPGVIAWHINNEMQGACFCPLCQARFRIWLKDRYGSIDAVNRAWNTAFWSHTYNSFDQIEAPMANGELMLHGLTLDWMRFTTWQHKDFTQSEINAIRAGGSRLPVTMNMMYDFDGLDYKEFADQMDYVSWDNYPAWHKKPERVTAADTAFEHDFFRSLKRQPFLMMESCPSATNWQSVSMLKRPGMLEAQELQAIAHGADGSLYFQIRQSRGASEKFHGAVIDHYGGRDTRVFRECVKTGADLEKIKEVTGSRTVSPAAVIFDTVSRWAMEGSQGPRNAGLHYRETCKKAASALQAYGVNADIIPAAWDFAYGDPEEGPQFYRVLICPMLYMTDAAAEEKLRKFAAAGGTLILTYWTGIADQTDLCYIGGTPHGLMEAAGVRAEEIDALYDGMSNSGEAVPGQNILPARSYQCENLCELERLSAGTEAVLIYGSDFYQGKAALTVHKYGSGRVYLVAADFEQDLWTDLVRGALREQGVRPILGNGTRSARPDQRDVSSSRKVSLPEEVFVTSRRSGNAVYLFLQNFGRETVRFPFPEEAEVLLGTGGEIEPFGTVVLKISLH